LNLLLTLLGTFGFCFFSRSFAAPHSALNLSPAFSARPASATLTRAPAKHTGWLPGVLHALWLLFSNRGI
jgi:hypothetical protein